MTLRRKTFSRMLQPIWQAKPETASRLRGRIEAVIDAARVAGHIDAHRPNPARWAGLPKPTKLTRGHHAAMPYAEVPAFVARLAGQDSISALALRFLIMTAARTSEVIGARWNEFDLENRLWTIPASRMKPGREHRVPLSGAAMALVEKLAAGRQGEFVFPGQKRGKPLSNMALEALLRRCTASAPHSGTGQVTRHHSLGNLPRRHCPTSSVTRRSKLIGAAMRWKSAASLWTPGPCIWPRSRKTTSSTCEDRRVTSRGGDGRHERHRCCQAQRNESNRLTCDASGHQN